MPIQPNFLERTAFYTLNAAPAPMLDLAAALSFHTLSTAVHLKLFTALEQRPSSPVELAQTLNLQERGTQRLLEALASIGYVEEKDGRYHNTPMTQKWFYNDVVIDLSAAMTCWDAFLRNLWPHGPQIIRSGERPFSFYDFTATTPGLSHAHQRMMQSNANLVGPDVVKKMDLPSTAGRLLDVAGGHGQFAIHFLQAQPQLKATIIDSEIALETARQNVEMADLDPRVDLEVDAGSRVRTSSLVHEGTPHSHVPAPPHRSVQAPPRTLAPAP
ncbi:MAG: class I SAM-dependent methyltransferase, partial [Candidatus Promineifilaceae bacterium]|nr:class I SAM-dependent methyltransferase [Candidatus Promineifilaceae bacterium]